MIFIFLPFPLYFYISFLYCIVGTNREYDDEKIYYKTTTLMLG